LTFPGLTRSLERMRAGHLCWRLGRPQPPASLSSGVMCAERLPSRLDDSVLSFLGQEVCARPVYGWGWADGEDGRENTCPVEVPPVLRFIVETFFDWNGERRGGIGRISEGDHPYHNKWVLFYTRVVGTFDFADYNLHIGANQPSLYPTSHDPRMAEAWPLPCFPGCRCIWGYGRIASTHQAIIGFEARRLREHVQTRT